MHLKKEPSYKRKRNIYIFQKQRDNFLHSPWAGGIILVVFTVIAILLANLPATKEFYAHLWHTEFGIGFKGFNLTKSLEHWINDGLMVIFFFVVGLEIKRELISGQLSSFKQASLPIAAALGGMLVPACIYALFNAGTPTEAGWGIPMATDIAFALGILSIVGKKVPVSLKIFLTALAIVDDLGAILVIAIFYSSQINWIMLFIAAGVFVYLLLLNRYGVTRVRYYIIPAVALWILFLESGIHATISGVLIAMTIPSYPRFSKRYFHYKTHQIIEQFKHADRPGVEVIENPTQYNAIYALKNVATGSTSPSQRLEHSLHSVVTYFIMPLFALANAGVVIDMTSVGMLGNGQSLGVILGLVAGKPLGIFLFSWLLIKSGFGAMPKNSTWTMLFAVGCLGGIGFTMSIFIDNLAFSSPEYVSIGKVSILMASILAALVGWAVMKWATQHRA